MIKVAFALVLSLVSLSSAFATDDATRSPRFVVNLLDYVAADYGGAVVDGKVVSEAEYSEQIEFVNAAIESLGQIPETKSETQLIDKLKELKSLVLAKVSAAEIANRAQAAKIEVIRIAKVEMAPTTWPNITNGAKLYSERCVTCHGATGHGDGVAGKGLEPAPANFHGEGMATSSPFKSFNVIRVGVPGTGMVAFNDLSDKEVWDLAFYVNALRFEGKAATAPGKGTATLAEVSSKTDQELLASFVGTDDEKNQTLIALRTQKTNSDGGNSLAIAKTQLESSLESYRAGDANSAKTKALTAYLEGIEPIEPTLKAKAPEFVVELENKMAAVRIAIDNKESSEALSTTTAAAIAAIAKADQILSTQAESSPTLALTLAAGILLREGFEAVLILIALLAVIRASGDEKAARWVHGGWIAAVGLGVIAWFFSGWLINMSGIGREAMEGTIALLAVVVLLYVGFWLHRRTEIQRWKQFLEGHVKQLVEGKNLWGLFAISFMAVFREAFETVLFLRAIWIDAGEAGRNAMWLGVFGAFGMVIVLAWALLKWSAKLPIRKVFTVSSVLIIALAIILAGKGISAFQETGWIPLTKWSDFQIEIIGFYATRETILAQLITAIVSMIAWFAGNKPSQVPATTARVA